MKTILLTFQFIILIILSTTVANAQSHCFWIANQSEETLNEIKLRESGTGKPFSDDLLPLNFILPGDHCSVRTSDSVQIWDLQITGTDGRPLTFTYKDVEGVWHIKQRFITINARKLHTLIIQTKRNAISTYKYFTSDQLDLGDPCHMWSSGNHLQMNK